jgi:hypothetical protein
MNFNIFNAYYLRSTAYDEDYSKYVNDLLSTVYADEYVMDIQSVLSEQEKLKQRELANNLANRYQLNFYICYGDAKIGWFYGAQTDHETFLIENVAIVNEHRNKGVFKGLLPVILQLLADKGFQKVCSKHAATNNTILVALLKAEFVITGFEISDADGLMIQLSYFFNGIRKKAIHFRAGTQTLTKEIAEAFSFKIE